MPDKDYILLAQRFGGFPLLGEAGLRQPDFRTEVVAEDSDRYDPYAAAKKASSIGPDPTTRPPFGINALRHDRPLGRVASFLTGGATDPTVEMGPADVLMAAAPLGMVGKAAKAAKAAKVAEETVAPAEQAARKVVAYHGTPHDFDRFDIGKIGTGEGVQAYGRGLYFAENEAVAQQYKDQLSHAKDVMVEGGGRLPPWVASSVELLRSPNAKAAQYSLDQLIDSFKTRVSQAEERVASKSSQWWNDQANIPGLKEVVQGLENVKAGAKIIPSGRVYEVAINADPDAFLQWDKPLHQQSEHVKAQLQPVVEWLRSRPITDRAKAGLRFEPPPTLSEKEAAALEREYDGLVKGNHSLRQAGGAPTDASVARAKELEDLLGRHDHRYDNFTGKDLYYALAGEKLIEFNQSSMAKELPQGFKVVASNIDPSFDKPYMVVNSAGYQIGSAQKTPQAAARGFWKSRGDLLQHGTPEALAANALTERNVPGIKYLDAGSRSPGGPGTHNYVVFNDQLIDILRKYGVAVPVIDAIRRQVFGQPQPPQR